MASKHGAIAKRYARALWLSLDRPDGAPQWLEHLDLIKGALKTSPDLRSLLVSPAFTFEQKSRVLRALMENYKTPETLANFLITVLKGGRIEALPEIIDGFRTQSLEARNALEAIVETAFPLNDSAERRLTDHLETLLGKRLAVTVRVFPDLVAGLRVKVGGKTLDFTFQNQLLRMERWLGTGQA